MFILAIIILVIGGIVLIQPHEETAPAAEDNTVREDGLLAGVEETPLRDVTEDAYKEAVSSGKLVALYFYANWCPICKAEFPLMEDAFDELAGQPVIGFRVNYKDSETSSFEEELARTFGIGYQHTKVLLRGDERLLKSPDSWDTERYLMEITSRI